MTTTSRSAATPPTRCRCLSRGSPSRTQPIASSPTWIAGVTLGVVVRMIALGHFHWDQLTFLLVALSFVGALAALTIVAMRRLDW